MKVDIHSGLCAMLGGSITISTGSLISGFIIGYSVWLASKLTMHFVPKLLTKLQPTLQKLKDIVERIKSTIKGGG